MDDAQKQEAKKIVRKADQYDDPQYNYQDYWTGRDYEHAAEEMAIKRLLRGKEFKHALVLVVRVLHHLPDPAPELNEIARVLRSGGTFILEFANDAHFLNRLRYAAHGKRVPKTPVDIRSDANRKKKDEIPFVNHHPKVILKMLEDAGFELETVLSGSNLRSPRLKRVLGKKPLLTAEKILQPMLAPLYFGPSIWFKLKKK
jgi:hypothetical protein